jgi:hypothetical protein
LVWLRLHRGEQSQLLIEMEQASSYSHAGIE